MKKSILILALALMSAVTIAQTKLTNGTHLAAIKDTVKISPKLQINLSKSDAIVLIDALKAGYVAMPESQQISAADYTHAKNVYEQLVGVIYQKWPDLAPKKPVN